jgi:hypothetical protein
VAKRVGKFPHVRGLGKSTLQGNKSNREGVEVRYVSIHALDGFANKAVGKQADEQSTPLILFYF